jgi:hypothetical protein
LARGSAARREEERRRAAEVRRVEHHTLRYAPGSNRARDHSRFDFHKSANGGTCTPNEPGLGRLPLLIGPRWRGDRGTGRENRTLLVLLVRQVSSPDERAPLAFGQSCSAPEEGLAPPPQRFKAADPALGTLRIDRSKIGRYGQSRTAWAALMRRALLRGSQRLSSCGAVTENRTRIPSVACSSSTLELSPQLEPPKMKTEPPNGESRATRGTCTLLIPRYQ